MIEFPPADFYTCRDAENLSHTDPHDAIVEAFEDAHEPGDGDTYEPAAARLGTIEVRCYKRAVIPDTFADALVDDLLVSADEEFNGGDGDHDVFEADAIEEFRAAARKLLATGKPWRCDETATVEITAEQALECIGEPVGGERRR